MGIRPARRRLGLRDPGRSEDAAQGRGQRLVPSAGRALQRTGSDARANAGRSQGPSDPFLLPRPGHGRRPLAATRQGIAVKLQTATRLGLYAVLELARDPARTLSAAELGERFGVSPHSLAKVLGTLSA
ncbi:MAG: hypothetical protein EPO10_12540, partial [Reyranella sp.]